MTDDIRSGDIDRIRESHRSWLARQGLLDRPWFILASAPSPTLPDRPIPGATHIYINSSGCTAAALGLPPADLTIRGPHNEWQTTRGLAMTRVLWVTNKRPFQLALKRLLLPARIGRIRAMKVAERNAIADHLLGETLCSAGTLHKPSNGMFAVLYGIFVGIPEIVFAGVSVDVEGYSYDGPPTRQLHREEDRLTMHWMAGHAPMVSTTEPLVHAAIGIPLISS